MAPAETAEPFLPPPSRRSLRSLRGASRECRGCPLHANATQTVFGEGASSARVMLVGEQPGDREDRAGEPFVGPAGRVLDESMEAAGIDRGDVYVTNAVKHFKWRQGRGKRRIHQRPSVGEVNACLPWLRAEVEAVGPAVIVCMGATAARAVLGPGIKVTEDRGSFVESGFGPLATVTVHPSSLLRIRDRAERAAAKREFAADLRGAAGRADLHV